MIRCMLIKAWDYECVWGSVLLSVSRLFRRTGTPQRRNAISVEFFWRVIEVPSHGHASTKKCHFCRIPLEGDQSAVSRARLNKEMSFL